jgi:hypothetical protein
MSDQTATTEAPAPAMQVVLEESAEFAPRTRKSTSDTLTALKPSLDAVKLNPGKIYTVARGLMPNKAASTVSLLNDHYPSDWTFAARSTTDGTAIVQAKYDPANKRPVRTVTRKAPSGAKPAAAPVKGAK